jgi:hypothetical protein
MTSSETINDIVNRAGGKLLGLSEAEVSGPAAPGKWCKKEILGHLIDSASNNHQRFIRAQLSDELRFPGYAQPDWVRVQAYAREGWRQLAELWVALNRHIAHVVQAMPREKLSVPCRIGEGEPMTLETVIVKYIEHMEHHLRQIDPAL